MISCRISTTSILAARGLHVASSCELTEIRFVRSVSSFMFNIFFLVSTTNIQIVLNAQLWESSKTICNVMSCEEKQEPETSTAFYFSLSHPLLLHMYALYIQIHTHTVCIIDRKFNILVYIYMLYCICMCLYTKIN